MAFTQKAQILGLHRTPGSWIYCCNRGNDSPSHLNSRDGDLRDDDLKDDDSWEIPELHGHCPVL